MTKQILCLHVLNAVQKSVRGYDVLHPRDPEGVLRHAVTLVACMHMYTHTHIHHQKAYINTTSTEQYEQTSLWSNDNSVLRIYKHTQLWKETNKL